MPERGKVTCCLLQIITTVCFAQYARRITQYETDMSLSKKLSSLSKEFLRMDFNKMLKPENLVANMPFFLFLALLAMIYIGNTHSVEKIFKQIDKTKNELKEIRWNYMSAKSDLMFKSKQTEVAKAVETLGLREITDPPKKIVVDK